MKALKQTTATVQGFTKRILKCMIGAKSNLFRTE